MAMSTTPAMMRLRGEDTSVSFVRGDRSAPCTLDGRCRRARPDPAPLSAPPPDGCHAERTPCCASGTTVGATALRGRAARRAGCRRRPRCGRGSAGVISGSASRANQPASVASSSPGAGSPETQRQRKVWSRYCATSPFVCVTTPVADTQTSRSTSATTLASSSTSRTAVTCGCSPGSTMPVDRRPGAVVGAPHEQHLLQCARSGGPVTQHDRRDARHPQQLLADHRAQVTDVGRDRHTGEANPVGRVGP